MKNELCVCGHSKFDHPHSFNCSALGFDRRAKPVCSCISFNAETVPDLPIKDEEALICWCLHEKEKHNLTIKEISGAVNEPISCSECKSCSEYRPISIKAANKLIKNHIREVDRLKSMSLFQKIKEYFRYA
jgi:hypothetical protein